jgi:hypothetical protein
MQVHENMQEAVVRMDIGEIIALVIAIYGSILATILGIREFLKERRNIKIILEYIYFYENGQITITNIVHRPITIPGIGMEKYMEMKGEGHYIKMRPDGIMIPRQVDTTR